MCALSPFWQLNFTSYRWQPDLYIAQPKLSIRYHTSYLNTMTISKTDWLNNYFDNIQII